MHDQDLLRLDLVKARQRRHRLARQVHVGHRLQQPQFADTGDAAKELALWRERRAQTLRQLVDLVAADGTGWTAEYFLRPGPDGSLKIIACRLSKKAEVGA